MPINMTTSTDTPRTDALMQGGCIATNIMEHARELERELNETRVTLDQMTEKALYWIERAYGTRKTDTHQQTKPSDTSINK